MISKITVLAFFLSIFSLNNSYSQNFYLNINGTTVMCPQAEIGDSGEVDGRVFTKRSRDQINFDNAASTCTSGISNMSELFSRSELDQSFNDNPITHWDVSNVTDMSNSFLIRFLIDQSVLGMLVKLKTCQVCLEIQNLIKSLTIGMSAV